MFPQDAGNASPFDVIVVGGGPGGSSAACAALRRGLTVAQVDRYAFPRIKPCGGGITIKSFKAAPYDLAPALRGQSRDVDLNVWQTRNNRFARTSSTLLRMVVRQELDNWLVSKNLERPGFQFFDDERALEISYDGVFAVRTTKRVLRGRHLVGADGAYSIVNKQFRATQPQGFAVAVEVVLRRDEAMLSADMPPCFDFGVIESGYGWVFPKDDHWNVGLYTLAKQKTLRESLAAYIAQKGFRVTTDPLATFVAHRFPYGGHAVTEPSAPVYVVGDAGGFGDAILGEGIYHAMESGRIAGETIADCVAGNASTRTYYERLVPTVLRDTRLTYRLSKQFYRDVGKSFAIFENPLVWRTVLEGYAEGATYAGTLRRAWWLLPKSVMLRRFRHQQSVAPQPPATGD
ncbi:MAG: NAD(P)/FAD-dependent oxidoreductase [Gemmatimonadaceae bacterium]